MDVDPVGAPLLEEPPFVNPSFMAGDCAQIVVQLVPRDDAIADDG